MTTSTGRLAGKVAIITGASTGCGPVMARRFVAEGARVLMCARREDMVQSTLEHHCSASMGVVLFRNHDASQDDILRWADAAMYQAKDAGRNAIRFHDPSSRDTAPRQMG